MSTDVMLWIFLGCVVVVLLKVTPVLSSSMCAVEVADRSSCNNVAGDLDQAGCEARGCCFDPAETDTLFNCWQPAAFHEIRVHSPTNGAAKRCHFPFIYEGKAYYTCQVLNDQAWCSLTYDYDTDQEMGYCLSNTCLMTTMGLEYDGDEDYHQYNYECQDWTATSPNYHIYSEDDSAFPDKTVAEASNHCRNPDRAPTGPWCYEKYYAQWDDTCALPSCNMMTDFCSVRIFTESSASSTYTVSSQWEVYYSASNADLDIDSVWCPGTIADTEWIKISFDTSHRVWGIITRGFETSDANGVYTYYVMTFTIEYGFTDNPAITYIYAEDGNTRVFEGNTDPDNEAASLFHEPFLATFVTIHPVTWSERPCLSFDVIGCPEESFCSDNPCAATATCNDDDKICVCVDGYEGINCDMEINECLSAPCVNGGTCTDLLSGFTCACEAVFSGDYCEVGDYESCSELASLGYTQSGMYNLRLWHNGECEMHAYPVYWALPADLPVASSVEISSYQDCWDACMAMDECTMAQGGGFVNDAGAFECALYTVPHPENGPIYQSSAGVVFAFKQCSTAQQVYCDFTDPVYPVTTVPQANPTTRCATCFGHVPYYNGVTFSQIRALKEKAVSTCWQEMHLNCMYTDAGRISLMLLDRSQRLFYDASLDSACKCVTGTCNPSGNCYCSLGSVGITTDEGPFSHEGLPVQVFQVSAGPSSDYPILNFTLKGFSCKEQVPACSTAGCQNGGTCDAATNICTCDLDHEGVHCEKVKDHCAGNPCGVNGPICDSGTGGQHTCLCISGYGGANCENELNECESTPCLNDGSCVDKLDAYECLCKYGYLGDKCQIDINQCTNDPCVHGTCENTPGYYMCNCEGGYTGQHCETELDECDSEPCQNGALCIDTLDAYGCDCAAGYEGTNCEIDIDDCASKPCLYGGVCEDLVDSLLCNCAPGYEGDLCQTDIVECVSEPCKNGGTCIEGINSFMCDCASGFEGDVCDKEIDLCLSAPCQNGGSCLRINQKVVCVCKAGYTGSFCEQDINECDPNPCVNGGDCEDKVNGYVCHCVGQFSGNECQYVKIDGQWTSWGEWQACTTICGNGMRLMERSCSNPPPQYGGEQCPGKKALAETCVGYDCTDSDGKWGGWGNWSPCSTTCNIGERTRTRACDSPPQSGTGEPCKGEDLDRAPCTVRDCGDPVDGAWSGWSAWSACDALCGVGVSSRERKCDSPPPVYGGRTCMGAGKGFKPCMTIACPVCSEWTEWGEWSECSTTCGNGQHSRSHKCTAAEPVGAPDKDGEAAADITTPAYDEAVVNSVMTTEYEHANCELQPCQVLECYHCNNTFDGTVNSLTCKGPTKACSENAKCMYRFDAQTGVSKGCLSEDLCKQNVSERCINVWDQTIEAIKSDMASVSGPLEPHPDTLYQMWNDLAGEICTICCTSSRCNRGLLPGGESVYRGSATRHQGLLVTYFLLPLLLSLFILR